MGDERDQDVQRTPLWPPDPEPDQTPRAAPTAAPTEPTSAEPHPHAPSQPPPVTHRWTPAPHAWPANAHPPAEARPQADSAAAPSPQQPWPSVAVPWEEQPDAALSLSDEPTQHINAAPAAPTPAAPSISDAQTMRMSAAPVSQTAPPTPPATPPAPPDPASPADGAAFAPAPRPEVDDAPTQRINAAPAAQASAAPTAPTPFTDVSAMTAPAAQPAPAAAPPAPPLLIPRRRKRKGAPLAWRLGLMIFVVALLLAGAGGLYSYASALAAAPAQLMADYCAALTHDDYRAAYRLLSADAQAKQTEAQYLADASVRDTIEGHVTTCVTTPTQTLSPLSFLRSPRSLIFNAQITRKQATSGQIALTRDAQGWHVAALSSPLQGIDLGPLYTEQALCKAFSQRAYTQAYALLSTPYQQEQGNATTFARAFGATLTVTGCTPNLKTYTVNSADQQASLDATLALSIAGPTSGSAPSVFNLPARLTFVRETTGWRVDAITPLLNQ